MLKVNDILYCKKNCIMIHNNKSATTLNKLYKIIKINDDTIFINDDIEEYHGFNLYKTSMSYYGIWFCTVKEYRKLKLKKLSQ